MNGDTGDTCPRPLSPKIALVFAGQTLFGDTGDTGDTFSPTERQDLDINTRTRNALQRSLRCLGERGFALLTGRWRALQHVTVSPSKIGDIARAALVLTHFEHGYIT